jgi:methyl-accepting chemotaxis protein
MFTFAVQALLHGAAGQSALLRTGLACFCVAYLAGSILAAYSLEHSTKGLYSSIIAQLRQMTSGEKDLSGRITIGSVDELGLIAAFVNEFNANLASSIDDLKGSQETLSGLGEELKRSAIDSESAISRIAGTIEAVGGRIVEQSDSVNESSSAVEEIAKNIESLDCLVKDQAASVTEASASIEEMVANINTITSSIDKVASQFGTLLTATGAGRDALAGASGLIRLIAERSETLLEANEVITSIASQTNLLAMNAAMREQKDGSREMSAGNATVVAEILRLRDSTLRIKESMDQMGQEARGIDGYAKKVSELAKGTMETIETVESAVDGFKT